jgi:hypothetical protein
MKSTVLSILFVILTVSAFAQGGIKIANGQTITLTTTAVEYDFNDVVKRMFPNGNQNDYNVRTLCIEYKGTPTGEFFVAVGEAMTAAHNGNGGHGVDNPRMMVPFRPGIDTFWLKGTVANEKVFITLIK